LSPSICRFEQPTVFELVINRKTANALGIIIAELIPLQADRVIEQQYAHGRFWHF
jgi:hypothetical protein